MGRVRLLPAAWIALLASCAPGAVRVEPYRGWREALTLSAPEPKISATIVPAIGGRIIRFERGAENILFENESYSGKTMSTVKPETIAQGYTGYNVDLGPELRRIPPHLGLWVGPYEWKAGGSSMTLTSVPDPSLGVRIEKVFSLDRTEGTLHLEQRLTNISDRDQSYCLWDRTLCRGGGYALALLHPRSRFKAGWALLKSGSYDGEQATHPSIRILDGVLVVHAEGKATKLGLDGEAGWIAYARGRLLFVKYFPVTPEGRYTDGGNTTEIYFDPNVCELEPLSPEVTLKPGQEIQFPETWILIELDHEVRSAEDARALVGRIPQSPFEKSAR